MSDPERLFRAEALQELTGRRGPGAVLRVTTPWVAWLYRAALLLTVAGLVAGYAIRVDRDVAGPARLGDAGLSFVAVLPVDDPGKVEPGDAARLEFDGPSGTISRRAILEAAGPATAEDLRRSGLSPTSGPALLVTGSLSGRGLADVDGALPGRLVVAGRSERLLTVVLRGFGGA